MEILQRMAEQPPRKTVKGVRFIEMDFYVSRLTSRTSTEVAHHLIKIVLSEASRFS